MPGRKPMNVPMTADMIQFLVWPRNSLKVKPKPLPRL